MEVVSKDVKLTNTDLTFFTILFASSGLSFNYVLAKYDYI